MSYLQEPKDPAEIITVGFDFSKVTDTPTGPSVSVAVRWGTETTPTLTKVGSPQTIGDKVYQQFSGGADLHDYDLKCLANTPSGDRISVDATLAVRTRPIK